MLTAPSLDLTQASVPVPEVRDRSGRLKGIDSIRAVSAIIVVIGHLGLFSKEALHSPNLVLRDAARLSAASWNGPAAVIVFFIVSGFCIHLPFRGHRPLRPMAFFLRRMLRLGLPVAIAYVFAKYVAGNVHALDLALWSIICEFVYYLLYPVLLPLGRRVGWPVFFLTAYGVSLVIAIANLHTLQIENNSYFALGPALTWLIGLPCWLLGCWLAEEERKFPILSSGRIWSLRIGMFVLSVILRIVKFHIHRPFASNAITLNIFAVLAFFWLGCEIAYYKYHEPSKILEWMGRWSYSLYLMHLLAGTAVLALNHAWLVQLLNSVHLATIFFAMVLALMFYCLVELPAHRAAIFCGRRL